MDVGGGGAAVVGLGLELGNEVCMVFVDAVTRYARFSSQSGDGETAVAAMRGADQQPFGGVADELLLGGQPRC